MTNPTTEAVTISIRANARQRVLSDRAAERSGRSQTDFMPEASCHQAEDVLLDQTYFAVDAPRFASFQALLGQPACGQRAPSPHHGGPGALGQGLMLAKRQPLTDDHQLDGSSSGEPSLDDWLRRQALANQAAKRFYWSRRVFASPLGR